MPVPAQRALTDHIVIGRRCMKSLKAEPPPQARECRCWIWIGRAPRIGRSPNHTPLAEHRLPCTARTDRWLTIGHTAVEYGCSFLLKARARPVKPHSARSEFDQHLLGLRPRPGQPWAQESLLRARHTRTGPASSPASDVIWAASTAFSGQRRQSIWEQRARDQAAGGTRSRYSATSALMLRGTSRPIAGLFRLGIGLPPSSRNSLPAIFGGTVIG